MRLPIFVNTVGIDLLLSSLLLYDDNDTSLSSP